MVYLVGCLVCECYAYRFKPGQIGHTLLSLSPSCIIWYLCKPWSLQSIMRPTINWSCVMVLLVVHCWLKVDWSWLKVFKVNWCCTLPVLYWLGLNVIDDSALRSMTALLLEEKTRHKVKDRNCSWEWHAVVVRFIRIILSVNLNDCCGSFHCTTTIIIIILTTHE